MFKSVSLKVVGDPQLHCESCEQRVVRVLKTLAGVRQVSADASTQRIEVLLDPSQVKPETLVERLGLLGYTTETAAPFTHPQMQPTSGARRS
ncbi:MAG: cation transporter [Rhodanobacter sp.]|nr:MAG: cation transporter [Rhodanobacter sp.]TAM14034.1 MAG: cation transporter [Rhodanobacter sp.]TAM37024.1 MAG: cation transporter [Rhodanobacter sp.]